MVDFKMGGITPILQMMKDLKKGGKRKALLISATGNDLLEEESRREAHLGCGKV